MPEINIMIKNKIATKSNNVTYICDNSDYVINFDFDDEWDAYDTKTARFAYGGQYTDIIFVGNRCNVPVITNTYAFHIGVFAGDLHTTTPVRVPCRKSILSSASIHVDPTPDVYDQLMELIKGLGGVDPDDIAKAVADYLAAHPIEETDPTVPEWAKAKTKPTYSATEVGAISQDDLQAATNEALAQAKASGEFDGADGADGGYYMPSVTRTDANTMRLSFSPSKEVMPAVADTDITLPSGGSGSVVVDSTLTVSGRAADAKAVGDALAKKQDKPDIRTVLDDVVVAGAQYYLGEQTEVSIVLPNDADVGQIVLVSWYNGNTGATLSITGTMMDFDFAPSANTRSEINALWDGTYWAVLGNEMAVPKEVKE